jgi:predicted GNAT family acetyltransferase
LESLPNDVSFEPTNSFSLFVDGQLVAFGQLILKSERRGHMGRIIVAPAKRGKGYGEALAGEILARARTEGCERACLYVDSANPAATQLYSKLGFRDAAVPVGEYSAAHSRYMERLLLDE